ncbi:major facilitator superfamily domain-containing protein [Mycena galericulata]|nr:major facilitator superfamily domain-containing protein [Mycena galericulata]
MAGKGRNFWLTLTAVIVTIFLSALDLTAVSTALPTITDRLHGGNLFVWVGSAYALSSTAILPLSGRLADIFGRRPLMLSSIFFFALGSALAGSAQNMHMMIAARTIQGIGGGGIINLCEIIISDLVPLSERGIYQGILGLTWSFASGIGPPIGGALASTQWRWLFCAGIAFVLVSFFLRVRTPPGSMREKLARVDWIGNAIGISGITLAILGLTWAGSSYPWGSAHVLAPLIIGLVLIIAFMLYEFRMPHELEPTVPYDLLSNRNSLSGYLSTFFHGITSITIIYYLPVYFQACFDATPIRSGVDMLATALVVAPFALIAGILVQVLNRYMPSNIAGWVLTIIGFGLLSMLTADATVSQWVGYQFVAAAGTGMIFAVTVFPILAPLSVERTAAALGFFAFCRAFAQTWGLTIASTILQNELAKTLPPAFTAQTQFAAGAEIAYAAIPAIRALEEPLKSEVRTAFAESMRVVWRTMIGISGAGLLTCVLLTEVPMVQHTDETYGLHAGEEGAAEKDVEGGTGTGGTDTPVAVLVDADRKELST